MRQNQHHYQTVSMLGCSLMPFQSPLCSPPPTHLLTKYGSCIMCVNISAHYILTIKHLTILFQNLLDPLWCSAGRAHCPRFVFSPGFVASSCPSRGRDPYLHTYGQTLACKYNTATDANRRDATTDDAFERFTTICPVSNI